MNDFLKEKYNEVLQKEAIAPELYDVYSIVPGIY